MPDNIHVFAIGSKARQGKDTIANFIKQMHPNTYIFHWADELYEEVQNESRKYPLITQSILGEDKVFYYNLLDDAEQGLYREFSQYEVPYLHKIMKERQLTVYSGMDEKDAPILQFWGTNFRREFCSNNYWVERLAKKINKVAFHHASKNEKTYICIADTRFRNEVFYIKNHIKTDSEPWTGYFVRVERYCEDGETQFFDISRDKNHPSEIDIDNVQPDYLLKAKSGDLNSLQFQTVDLLTHVNSR